MTVVTTYDYALSPLGADFIIITGKGAFAVQYPATLLAP